MSVEINFFSKIILNIKNVLNNKSVWISVSIILLGGGVGKFISINTHTINNGNISNGSNNVNIRNGSNNIININSGINNNTFFTTTIHVKDWKGKDNQNINASNSAIRILDKDRKGFTTGSVEFSEIPIQYRNKKVKVEFFPGPDCEGWDLVDDSILLKEESSQFLEIRVKMKGLEQIYGIVTDEKNKPLDSAKIEIIGTKPLLSTYSYKGKYQIDIPIEQQEYYQEITVSKPNFKDTSKYINLENNKNPINFVLRKYHE